MTVGDIFSVMYWGKHRKFKIIKLSGDFGDLDLNGKDCKENRLEISKINYELEKLQLIEQQEENNSIASVVSNKRAKDAIIPASSSDKFLYYISQMDTVIVFEQAGKSDKTLPTNEGDRDSKVTYNSIGGFSAQMEAIRETIELPLKHPRLFRECGLYLCIFNTEYISYTEYEINCSFLCRILRMALRV